MKTVFVLIMLALFPVASQAAETLCGVSVQDSNIIYNRVGNDVAFLRAILSEEQSNSTSGVL